MEKKLYAAYTTDHLKQTVAVTDWTLRPLGYSNVNDGIWGNLEVRGTAPIEKGFNKVYLVTLQEVPQEIINANRLADYIAQAKKADISEPASRKFRTFAEVPE